MSWDPGFEKNAVQNTGIINQGKRSGQNLGTDVGLGKETKFGIAMTEVQDAGFLRKRGGNVGSGASLFRPFVNMQTFKLRSGPCSV